MMEKEFRILVIDDDIYYASICAKAIASAGYNVSPLGTADEALNVIKSDNTVSLMLVDLKMPDKDGIQLLREVKSINPSIEVIIMTGYGTIATAVSAIKENAVDYISKPFDKDELLSVVQKIYKMWKYEKEIQQIRQSVSNRLKFDGFVFKNASMVKVYDLIISAARCDCSVFITGESGTGKELIARTIHTNSHRATAPFVVINCGASSDQLLERELFGYKKGAVAGAEQYYKGLFAAADGGTIFLDEIIEMPASTQVKLLRTIQDKSVRPVGSVQEKKINVRFIASTNSDLTASLSQKTLREDLYNRLNVIPIHSPPLREICDDIPDLINYFVEKGNKNHEHKIKLINDYAMKRLVDYPWAGNIREVENLVERFFVEVKSDIIKVRDLPAYITDTKESNVDKNNIVPSFSEAERDLVIRALKEAKGNKSKAAEILGISRPRLYKKIELYNINSAQM